MRNLRAYLNLTVRELAENVDIEENTLRKYETDYNEPMFKNSLQLINFFEISFDFLLCGEKTKYLRNIRLINLAEKIDKLTHNERSKIESVISILLKDINITNKEISILDTTKIELTNNIYSNIKTLRHDKQLSQPKLSELLNVSSSQIIHYEKSQIPPAVKLIKLSEIFNISIHAIATGIKLEFKFNNKNFLTSILNADKFLPLEDQKFLIKLMKNILL
jgi:transcriptional regulator with XRE-family HTH domain